MATLSSAELKVKKKEAEERMALLQAEVQAMDDRLASRCDWPGPTLFVKIHADTVTVITSTDVIGKDEFAESVFRKRLEELTEGRAADEGMAERKTGDSPMLEMRFDRNGEILQLIVDAMRGYPILVRLQHLKLFEMFLVDCEFYQLSSLLAKFDTAPKTRASETRATAWDPSRIESATHSIVESLLVRKDRTDFKCNGLTDVLRSGDNKWVEFNIQKNGGHLMFGVIEIDNFGMDGYFGLPLKGVGYYAYNGHLYYPSTSKPFAERSGAGDNIRIAVRIAVSGKSARMTVSKNGSEIGSEELSKHISVKGGLLFAVCTYNAGDEVKIVGSGM